MKVLLTALLMGFLTTTAGGAFAPLHVVRGSTGVDTVSTLEALKRGGREANPVVATFASHVGAFYGPKVATTAGTIWAAEKLWKRNHAAAIGTMLAVNVGYAWVAHHNYQALDACWRACRPSLSRWRCSARLCLPLGVSLWA